MLPVNYTLFPEIKEYAQHLLQTGSEHIIYYEECGNPSGYPVVFLHGGPGSGCNPTQRRFFDPEFYRIILLDQRGCGRSAPAGCTDNNTISDLVDDIDAIRVQLKIDHWLVFGGSWGSTLALAYALAHTGRVAGLILRGIFLSRQSEIDWFLRDIKQVYPEVLAELSQYLPVSERDDLLKAYAARIFSDDVLVASPAAKQWNNFENSIMSLLPRVASNNVTSNNSAATATVAKATPSEVEIARARVQIHYIKHLCFIGERDVLSEVATLADIPTTIIQGRYDMVCPAVTAYELSLAMPHAIYKVIPDAGHSAMETGVTSALVEATEQFKRFISQS